MYPIAVLETLIGKNYDLNSVNCTFGIDVPEADFGINIPSNITESVNRESCLELFLYLLRVSAKFLLFVSTFLISFYCTINITT